MESSNALKVKAGTTDATCTHTLTDIGSISVYYDPDTELVNMDTTLPQNSFLGWGWGATMVETEMLIFSANTDADTSYATTYYSTS